MIQKIEDIGVSQQTEEDIVSGKKQVVFYTVAGRGEVFILSMNGNSVDVDVIPVAVLPSGLVIEKYVGSMSLSELSRNIPSVQWSPPHTSVAA